MARAQSLIEEIDLLSGKNINIMFATGQTFGPYVLMRSTTLGDAIVVKGSKEYIINLEHVMMVNAA